VLLLEDTSRIPLVKFAITQFLIVTYWRPDTLTPSYAKSPLMMWPAQSNVMLFAPMLSPVEVQFRSDVSVVSFVIVSPHDIVDGVVWLVVLFGVADIV